MSAVLEIYLRPGVSAYGHACELSSLILEDLACCTGGFRVHRSVKTVFLKFNATFTGALIRVIHRVLR